MDEITIDIDPRIINPVFRPLISCTKPKQIFFGGSSSGKSVFAIGQRMIIDLILGGRNYLCTHPL